jgi:hypothetical protein
MEAARFGIYVQRVQKVAVLIFCAPATNGRGAFAHNIEFIG